MALKNLFVVLSAKTDGFTRELAKAERQLDRFSYRVDKIGSRLTTTLTAPILAVGAAAGKMAMDVVESENLFEVSMGKMASSARQWSEGLRKQLGLNAYEVRKNVGTFNLMLGSMGLSEKAAFDMSKGLTQLSYDMSSLYNLPTAQAFEKLQSGISGEIEPLRRLGIVVDENTIKHVALSKGIIKQGEEMSQAQKVVARYLAIMEQTSKAQTDMARTIDSPANKLRILWEQVKNVATDLGMALMPTIQTGLTILQDWAKRLGEVVTAFGKLSPATKTVIIDTLLLTAAVGPALIVIGKLAAGWAAVAGILKMLGIGKLATAIVAALSNIHLALAAWLGGWATWNEAVLLIFGGTTGAIIGQIALWIAAFALVVKNWDKIYLSLIEIWRNIANAFGSMVDKVFALAEKLPGGMGKWAKEQRYALKEYFRGVNEDLWTKEFHMVLNMKPTETDAFADKAAKLMRDAIESIKKAYKGINLADLLAGLDAGALGGGSTNGEYAMPQPLADEMHLASLLREQRVKDMEKIAQDAIEIDEPTVRENSFWHSDTWRVLAESVRKARALMKEPLEIDEPKTPSGGPNMGGMMADWVRNVWKPRREAALAAEDAAGRYAMAMGRIVGITYQADLAWAKFKTTASDAITAILEGSKTLGDVLEGIFKTKAHDSIKTFVDDALDSFRDLKKQGMDIFKAIAEAIKKNFSALDAFGGMGIGMTAGAAIGGSQSGSMAGSLIGALLGGPIGAIAGGLLGGLFGPKPAPAEDKPQPQALNQLAGNLGSMWKTTQQVRQVIGRNEETGRAIWGMVDVPITPVIDQAVLNKIKEQIGTTLDSMGNALGSAFEAASYEEFTAKFGQNLEGVTKKALISAFMASDAIRPLLDNLSNVITQAVLDGTLTAQERQSIVDLYSQITAQSGTFYEALQQLGIATDGVAGSMAALGESMRNVPAGFKIAAARYDVTLPKYHSGGYVPKDGPALLRRGEVVLTPEQRSAGGGMYFDFRGATIYGINDLERRIREAVSKATMGNNLAGHGLATGGAY
jgi:hypothetical protein